MIKYRICTLLIRYFFVEKAALNPHPSTFEGDHLVFFFVGKGIYRATLKTLVTALNHTFKILTFVEKEKSYSSF